MTLAHDLRELAERLSNLAEQLEQGGIEFADDDFSRDSLRVSRREGLVEWKGHDIGATLYEFRIVSALARHPGLVFSRDQIMDLAHGKEFTVEERTIDSYVKRIRRKFEAVDPGFNEIETLYGFGYRWRK